MTRPRLLDLFCGAGGAAMGYHRAGFDVVGVDIVNQPHYPFEFHRGDALQYLTAHGEEFDAIHASPPCQGFSRMSVCRPGLADTYPDLLGPTRDTLDSAGRPYVIENVPGAPMRRDVELCGCMFGLRSPRGFQVRRPRWFETSPFLFLLTPAHSHHEPALPVAGHSPGKQWMAAHVETYGPAPRADERRNAMGVPWMNREELAEAIPPAFTEFIGAALLTEMGAAA